MCSIMARMIRSTSNGRMARQTSRATGQQVRSGHSVSVRGTHQYRLAALLHAPATFLLTIVSLHVKHRRNGILILRTGGYVYATDSGTYTFTLFNVDDHAMLWTGPKAVAGWDSTNPDLNTGYTGSVDMVLQGGTYLPVRVYYWDGGGGAGLQWSVTYPNGDIDVHSDRSSPLLVRYSCDGIAAPPYTEAFGEEGPKKPYPLCNNQGMEYAMIADPGATFPNVTHIKAPISVQNIINAGNIATVIGGFDYDGASSSTANVYGINEPSTYTDLIHRKSVAEVYLPNER